MGVQEAIEAIDQSEFHMIEVDGAKIRYLHRVVNSDLPPLLVCNGLAQSIEVLLPLLDEINDRCLIAIDMPGTGRSHMIDGVSTIPDYADFTLRVLERIGIENFDILGISWGGALAQQIAPYGAGSCGQACAGDLFRGRHRQLVGHAHRAV